MNRDRLQKALNDLKKCHKNIQKDIAKIEDSVFEELFGEFYSRKLHQDMKKYGDGHILYGVPRSISELTKSDAVVLIAVTSPKLSTTSDFNPTTPLHTILYWRDGKGLTSQVYSTTKRREYGLHFMTWQQNSSIHGIDDAHARRNRRILVKNRPKLEILFQQEIDASIKFINHCKGWLNDNGKPMVVITHAGRNRFNEPISSLISDNDATHIKANLRGRNHRIMGRISDVLP